MRAKTYTLLKVTQGRIFEALSQAKISQRPHQNHGPKEKKVDKPDSYQILKVV